MVVARYLASAVFVAAVMLSLSVRAETPVVEQLLFDTNPPPDVKPVKITATLHLPLASTPVPAMVIINSSGGVLDWIEGYYARELSQRGIAALIVDSFKPRGVKNVVSNQNLVTSWLMENDA